MTAHEVEDQVSPGDSDASSTGGLPRCAAHCGAGDAQLFPTGQAGLVTSWCRHLLSLVAGTCHTQDISLLDCTLATVTTTSEPHDSGEFHSGHSGNVQTSSAYLRLCELE